jgi:O6-methylguanine-DNA--protein-cysteine methyltransferase
MRRYKELAELIRAKKAAVAQAAMANPTAAKKP